MAKRILNIVCVILSVTAVLLCGCDREQTGESIITNFKGEFSAVYRGMQLEGSLTHLRQGVFSLSFSKPETLRGLQIHKQNGVLSLIRDNARATADEPYLPPDSFPLLLAELLDAAANKALPDGGNTCTLSLSAGEATLTADENRLPQSAAIDSAAFAVSFQHCEPLQ